MADTKVSAKTVDATKTLSDTHAWHFFIYEVLYVAVLGALVYELFRIPTDWNLWFVQLSIALMYSVDCIHTRAHLHSFDPELADKSENLLNASIAVGMGYAFSFATEKRLDVTYAILAVIVVAAGALNLRKGRRRTALHLDLPLLVCYSVFAWFAFTGDWLAQWWTVAASFVPFVYYALYSARVANPRV